MVRKNRTTVPVMAAILYILCGTAFYVSGQVQYQPNIVFWSAEESCRGFKLADGDQRKFTCRHILEKERSIRIVDDGSVKLSVALGRSRNRILVRTRIDNNGVEKLSSDFAKWNIAHYDSEDAFLAGTSPIKEGVPLPAPAPSQIAEIGEDQFEAPPVILVRPVSDPRLLPRAAGSRDYRIAIVLPIDKRIGEEKPGVPNPPEEKNTIFKDRFLTKKSLAPKKNSNGIVYFNRIPNSKFQLVFLHIGNTTYVFELH
jgi:hypothetical protein